MKTYILGNLDGIHAALVAASSVKAACELFGTTQYQFRQHGGHSTKREDLVELATANPGMVWWSVLHQYPASFFPAKYQHHTETK